MEKPNPYEAAPDIGKHIPDHATLPFRRICIAWLCFFVTFVVVLLAIAFGITWIVVKYCC